MKTKLIKAFAAVIIISACLFAAWQVPGMLAGKLDENAAEKLENAVRSAAVACYSTEGMYPDRLEYLISNYGLRPDSRFEIKYVIFASNLPPDITVIQKR